MGKRCGAYCNRARGLYSSSCWRHTASVQMSFWNREKLKVPHRHFMMLHMFLLSCCIAFSLHDFLPLILCLLAHFLSNHLSKLESLVPHPESHSRFFFWCTCSSPALLLSFLLPEAALNTSQTFGVGGVQ